ncbi:MAG: hypothetical protein AAGC95_14260 [Pseudomonadota bacterium]
MTALTAHHGIEGRALRAAVFGAGVFLVAAVFAYKSAPPPASSFLIAKASPAAQAGWAADAAGLAQAFEAEAQAAFGVIAPDRAGYAGDASFQSTLMRLYAEARATGDIPRAAALKEVARRAERFSNAATPAERRAAAKDVEAALSALSGTPAAPKDQDATPPRLVPVNR